MKRLVLLALCAISLSAQAAPYRYNVIVKFGEPRHVEAIVYGANDALLVDETATTAADKPLRFASSRDGVDFTIHVIPAMNGDVVTTFEAKRGDEVLQRDEKTIPSGKLESDEELITVHVKDASLSDMLATFETLTGRRIKADPSVDGAVTLDADGVNWQVALTRAVAPLGLMPRMQENGDIVLLRLPK